MTPPRDDHLSIDRSTTTDYGVVMQKKVDLVSAAAGTRSLRDFGGLYLVHGKYLLEPALRLGADFCSMVDVTPRAEFEDKIREAKQQRPGLEVEFVRGDFRERTLYDGMRPVDTSILFEVLLHQENYMSILADVTRRTDRYLCIAQPCMREECFLVPASATLLQFWDSAQKRKYGCGFFWPEEPVVDRYDTRYWMWGHSTSHLISATGGFGWDLDFVETVSDVCGDFWEFSLLRFRKRGSA